MSIICSTARGVCDDRRRRLEERGLSSSPKNKPTRRLPSSVTPLGQLFARYRVRVLTRVESANEARPTSVPTTDVERPTDQRAVLILVELDGINDGGRDALFRRANVGSKEGSRRGFAQWDGIGDLGALGLTTEVSVSDGRESDGVVVDVGNKPFKVLHHADSGVIDDGCRTVVGLDGLLGLVGCLQTGLRETAFEARRPWTEACECVARFACTDVFACAA